MESLRLDNFIKQFSSLTLAGAACSVINKTLKVFVDDQLRNSEDS